MIHLALILKNNVPVNMPLDCIDLQKLMNVGESVTSDDGDSRTDDREDYS
jgi:hypothetical protein